MVTFHMSSKVVIPHSRLSPWLTLRLRSGAPVILTEITLETSFPVHSIVVSFKILLVLKPLCLGTACYVTLVKAIVHGFLVFAVQD